MGLEAKINLTRHTDYEKFVSRDLADCRAFSQFLEPGEAVLDVGTGGGVPGVVLAILRDDLKIALCESVGKKARVVADILQRLGLAQHAVPRPGRRRAGRTALQHADRSGGRPAGETLEWFQPRWRQFDRLLVLKGPGWVEERGEARHLGLMHDLTLRKLPSYPLPGTESESVLLQIAAKGRIRIVGCVEHGTPREWCVTRSGITDGNR